MKKYLGLVLVLLLTPAIAGAAVISFLTESNALPDGIVYGRVDVTQGSDATRVDFSVDMLTPPLVPGSNFGIQRFAFNTSLLNPVDTGNPSGRTPLSYFQFSGPAGWNFNYNENASEFGMFELDYSGTGSTRIDPLLFTLRYNPGTGFQDILPEDFFVANSDGSHFVAHVAGFQTGNPNLTSAFFSDGNASVPEPGAMILLGFGLIGLAGWGRNRTRK